MFKETNSVLFKDMKKFLTEMLAIGVFIGLIWLYLEWKARK